MKSKLKILSEISLVQNKWLLYPIYCILEEYFFFSPNSRKNTSDHVLQHNCLNRWMHCPFCSSSIMAFTSTKNWSLSESSVLKSSGILRTSLQSSTILQQLHILQEYCPVPPLSLKIMALAPGSSWVLDKFLENSSLTCPWYDSEIPITL